IGARGSGTAEEEEAAGYVRSVLDGLNIAYEEQPFRSAASAWRPFAVMLGLAVLATLLAPLFLPASSLLAAFLLALSMWLTIRESLLQDTILRRLLPPVNSRNVSGRLPSEGEPLERIVLVAHLDTHRTPYFHRSRKRQHWFGFMIFFAETGTVINILLYLALSISGEVWLWWASLPFALLHLLMALVCAAVERTPYSPGANDNAAAVGTALQVARELRDGPLVNTDLWFLFSGCEEVGAYGVREFLKEYSPAIQGAQFIDLEPGHSRCGDQGRDVPAHRLRSLADRGSMRSGREHLAARVSQGSPRLRRVGRHAARRLSQRDAEHGAGGNGKNGRLAPHG
ncbi:MAG: M28 family peptidase, partial [Chloroflexota bacterium]